MRPAMIKPRFVPGGTCATLTALRAELFYSMPGRWSRERQDRHLLAAAWLAWWAWSQASRLHTRHEHVRALVWQAFDAATDADRVREINRAVGLVDELIELSGGIVPLPPLPWKAVA